MKNIQKIALTLIVGVMAIGFSAFKTGNEKVTADWYRPTGTILMSSPARLVFSNYDPTPLEQPTDCGNQGNKVCASRFPVTSNPATASISKQ